MPRSSWKLGSYGLAAVAIGLFGLSFASIVDGSLAPEARSPLQVDATVKSLGTARSGLNFPVEFRLTNRGSAPIRVVGATYSCNRHACLSGKDLPISIPGGESRPVRVNVATYQPGDYSHEITFYTDAPGRSSLVLTIRGRVAGTDEQVAASRAGAAPR